MKYRTNVFGSGAMSGKYSKDERKSGRCALERVEALTCGSMLWYH